LVDVLIKNGFVVDGTGRPGFPADIAVTGDRIVKIAPDIKDDAGLVIDAKNKLVIPGMIDPHTHEEWVLFLNGDYELFLRQGVTTVVSGNCGHSVFPGPIENVMDYWYGNGLANAKQRDSYKKRFPSWMDFAEYRVAAEKAGTNINHAPLIGHGCIRWTVMGGAFDRPPNKEESRRIEEIIRHNLSQGAWGVSFGLAYVPSRYAQMEELVDICSLAREYGAVAAAHLRNYIGIKPAVEEFLEVGRRSGAKLQLSHVASACPEAFQSAEQMAKDTGRVLIDTIPRSTGHCVSRSRLIQFIMSGSDVFFSLGYDAVKQALTTSEGRAQIVKDTPMIRGDKEDIFVISSDDPSLEGRPVAEIARERGISPDDCLFDLLIGDTKLSFWLGGPRRKDFIGEHDERIIQNPYVCVGSDELKGDPEDPYDWYELQRRGAFPIFMNMYRRYGVPTEEIVRKNTSLVARHFGMEDRGELREGYFADIAVLDLDAYRFSNSDPIDYTKPLSMAEGVSDVLVNGQPALLSGQLKRSRSGKVLKHKS